MKKKSVFLSLLRRYHASRLFAFGITFSEFVFNLYQKALAGHNIEQAHELFTTWDALNNN